MIPDAAAIGSKEVNADEVIERGGYSASGSCCVSVGDSETDACRSSSAICGVNQTGVTGVGVGECERRTG
jgi:hypothetical protein